MKGTQFKGDSVFPFVTGLQDETLDYGGVEPGF